MHFSAEVSETFRHCKNLRHFGTKRMVPKCLGSEVRSEVSIHPWTSLLADQTTRSSDIVRTSQFVKIFCGKLGSYNCYKW